MSKRILFAEDEELIRNCASELLREEGYDVTEAQSGDEAALALDGQSFDVLLTDVRMPGSKDGIDLAVYARKKNPTLPIIVITGYADQLATRIKALNGSLALVRKPFPLSELLSALSCLTNQATQRAG